MHVLLHISDVHLGLGEGPKPVAKVMAAVRGLNCEPSCVILALTGDMAYSGKSAEYEIVWEYFSQLQELVKGEFDCECHIVVCPGNHDCDFPEDRAVRSLVVEKIRSTSALPDSQGMVDECTRVQDAFFEWASVADERIPPPSGPVDFSPAAMKQGICLSLSHQRRCLSIILSCLYISITPSSS